MAIDSDHNYNSRLCLNSKRCFLSLVLFNSVLACIYYIYDHNQSSHKLHVQAYTRQFPLTFIRDEPSKGVNRTIELIRQILENEYNHDDLQMFYDLADKQFTLGLRCTRKENPPPAITNLNVTIVEQNNSNLTTLRSSSIATTRQINRLDRSLSSRHRRRNFYSYIISNANSCSVDPADLLIMIISKSENYKTRDAIRRTWGSGKNLGDFSSIAIKLLFLIDFDDKLNYNIQLENNLFHDIVQVELPQQYTLVTHRVLSIFEWSFRFCRTAKFLFKTDDDIFINLILLLKFVAPLMNKATNDTFRIADMTIYGYKHYNPRVFRQANDPVGARYVVTVDEFPCGNYPDFLSGFGYLIPKAARDALVYASYQDPHPPFRISDVYVTGILPDYLSLPRQPMSDYNIRYQGNCEDFFNRPTSFACAVGLHHGDTSDVFDKFNRYWQRVRQFL